MGREFKETWSKIQKRIDLLIDKVENGTVYVLRSDVCIETNQLCTNLCMLQKKQKQQHSAKVESVSAAPDSDYQSMLYRKYRDVMESYLQTNVLPSLRTTIGTNAHTKESATQFLEEVRHRWYNHHVMIKWLKSAFAYLDNNYVRVLGVPTLYQVGLEVFHAIIYTEFQSDIASSCIKLINDDREDYEQDHQNHHVGTSTNHDKILVKSAIELFETMGMGSLDVQQTDFEKPFLEASREYYLTRRMQLLNLTSLSARSIISLQQDTSYHARVERILVQEKQRAIEFSLPPSTKDKLLKTCTEVFNAKRSTGSCADGSERPGVAKGVEESFLDAVFNLFR